MDDELALSTRVQERDPQALGALLRHYHDRLMRMLVVRWDHRLSARITPEDVVQEASIDVVQRIDEYLAQVDVPFYVWLRFLTLQRLAVLQRTHLGADKRDVRRECSPAADHRYASPDSMAGQFVSHLTSPSQAAMRHELQHQVHDALAKMDPLDREVLALRHFEELSNHEVASILGISRDAASKRHVRALVKLQEILMNSPLGDRS